MKTIYVLSGIARSGKSTYAKSLQGTIVSRDIIREKLFGDKSCMDYEEIVSNEFDKQFSEALSKNENIIIDNTNLKIKYINSFIEQAKKNKFNIEIIRFFVPLKTLYKRAKDSNFPISVINRMIISNEMHKFELSFPHIKITDIINEYVDISDYYDLMDFDQENPNHSHTLLLHSLLTEENLANMIEKDINCSYLGKIHDLGKIVSKVYNEEKKKCTYNGHANGSWYLSRSIKGVPKYKSYLALLHMHHFNMENGMSKKKYYTIIDRYYNFCKNEIGKNTFIYLLENLEKADMMSTK